MSPSDPNARYRPFRAVAYGVHTTIVAAFCIFITWSVVRSVRSMTPPVIPPVATAQLSVSECVARAEKLWDSLETRRQTLGSEVAPGSMDTWAIFRVQWLQGLRLAQAECVSGPGDRRGVVRVLSDLERLEDLYTTHAVQYVGEIGPTLQQFKLDLAAAK